MRITTVSNFKTTTQYNICNERIDEEKAETIAKTIDAYKKNIIISLCENQMSNKAMELIAASIEKSNVEKLYFFENMVEKKGITYLLDIIKNNKTLITLEFAQKGLSKKEIQLLAKALKSNKTLQNIYLTINDNNYEDVNHFFAFSDSAKSIKVSRKINTIESLPLKNIYNSSITLNGSKKEVPSKKTNEETPLLRSTLN
ncbi:MAG: hypothetical protein LEGION0398_MBIBDBAK_01328 [Legionellaceae bacterium]